jgi:hypothetical protein
MSLFFAGRPAHTSLVVRFWRKISIVSHVQYDLHGSFDEADAILSRNSLGQGLQVTLKPMTMPEAAPDWISIGLLLVGCFGMANLVEDIVPRAIGHVEVDKERVLQRLGAQVLFDRRL